MPRSRFLLVQQASRKILAVLDIGGLPPELRGKLMFFVHWMDAQKTRVFRAGNEHGPLIPDFTNFLLLACCTSTDVTRRPAGVVFRNRLTV